MGTDFRLLRRLAVGIVAVLATMLVACSDDDALPTDPMAKSYKAEVRDGVVSLLHVSDVHGSSRRIELSAQPRDHRHKPQRGGRGALWGKRTEE